MKYCESILHELSFHNDKITPCCCAFSIDAPTYQINTQNLEENKIEILKNINASIENYSCKDCIFLKEDDSVSFENVKNFKFNSIFLRHWTTCNANCVHCDNNRDKSYGRKPNYNPINMLKHAYENNLIDRENLVVRFQGGDIGVLDNFEELMELFNKSGYKSIHFSTNNIVYQPLIEEVLKQGKGSLNTSIDCGTKETYFKIKRVDKYDAVIENLKKYVKVTKDINNITIHYIIINGYNNNKKEIKNFFKLMKKTGIKSVGVRIDHKDLDDYMLNNVSYDVIQQYKELVTYFYKLAKKYSFNLDNDKCIEQNFVLNESKKSNFFRSFLNKFKKHQ